MLSQPLNMHLVKILQFFLRVRTLRDSIKTGGRSRKSIMDTVSNNLKYLRYAYNKRLQDKSWIKGTIITKFAIDEFGKVIFLSCDNC